VLAYPGCPKKGAIKWVSRLSVEQSRCTVALIMVALCNRTDHYIFMLFLFFPRLISAVGDWMFTILWHMVWP